MRELYGLAALAIANSSIPGFLPVDLTVSAGGSVFPLGRAPLWLFGLR